MKLFGDSLQKYNRGISHHHVSMKVTHRIFRFSDNQLNFLELDILQNDEVVGNLKVCIKRDDSMDIDGINVPVLSVIFIIPYES